MKRAEMQEELYRLAREVVFLRNNVAQPRTMVEGLQRRNADAPCGPSCGGKAVRPPPPSRPAPRNQMFKRGCL